jgi:hypothetical protein
MSFQTAFCVGYNNLPQFKALENRFAIYCVVRQMGIYCIREIDEVMQEGKSSLAAARGGRSFDLARAPSQWLGASWPEAVWKSGQNCQVSLEKKNLETCRNQIVQVVSTSQSSINPIQSNPFKRTYVTAVSAMICRYCLQRASRVRPTSAFRALNTSIRHSSSSAATEPFTTPIGASPSSHGQAPSKKNATAAVVRSSVPAGTPLKGLNYMKDKPDPLAMEDEEYPDWLWNILKDRTAAKGDAAIDSMC